MTVIIGIDPHKASHSAVAINGTEEELTRVKVRSGATQVEQLAAWATSFPTRAWAIESAGGLGYLLAQQLVAAGETVVDVPATLACRARLLASGRSNKRDPNVAFSLAIAALRCASGAYARSKWSATTRSSACRRNAIATSPTSEPGSCRLHALLAELAAGGIAKEINASDVYVFLETLSPTGAVAQLRYDLAVELLDDIRRLDDQLKRSHKRIRDAVRASGTTVTDIFGVGPIIAATLIGNTGHVTRFANRDQFAA